MSVFGDYNSIIPTWNNGASPAINASRLQAICDLLNLLDEEARRSQSKSFKSYLEYFASRSTKPIEFFEDSSEWSSAGTVTLSDEYNDNRIGKASLKLTETDNTSDYNSAYKTISSMDLTEFTSGDAAGTDAIVGFIYYCSDSSLYNQVTIKLGDDNTNNYSYNDTSPSSGWNCITPQKSDFTTNNSPSGWDDITYIRIEGYTKANAQNEYVQAEYVGLSRVDADYDYIQQPMVLDDGAGNWDIVKYLTYDKFELLFDPIIGKIGITKGSDAWEYGISVTGEAVADQVKSFICVAEFYVQIENEIPLANWYSDSNNYIHTYITGGTAYLLLYESGAGTPDSVVLNNTLEKGTKVRVIFEKNDAQVRVQYIFNNNESIKVLEDETTITDSGELMVNGSYDSENFAFMTDLEFANTELFMQEKISFDNKVIIKKVDETRSSVTTLDYDNELYVDLQPNGIYEIYFNLLTSALTTTPDIKIAYYSSGDVECISRILCGMETGMTTSSSANLRGGYTSSLTTAVNYGTYASGSWIIEKLLIRTYQNGGRLHLQWAQNSASSVTTIEENSYLTVKKVSR